MSSFGGALGSRLGGGAGNPALGAPGIGGFFGPGLGVAPGVNNSGNVVINANEIRVYQFTLYQAWLLTRGSFRVNGGANGTLFSFGIYDAKTKNVVVSIGPFTVAGVPSQYTQTFAQTLLPPGVYYSVATANSVANISGPVMTVAVVGDALIVYNTQGVRNGTAGNSVNAVLPATLGALVADNTNLLVSCPFWEP